MKNVNQKLTQEEINQIEIDYISGVSIKDIHKKYPVVSYTALWKRLDALTMLPLSDEQIFHFRIKYKDNPMEMEARMRMEATIKFHTHQLVKAYLALKAFDVDIQPILGIKIDAEYNTYSSYFTEVA